MSEMTGSNTSLVLSKLFNKIHRHYRLNQLAVRPLIAEVHAKMSSAIPCTAAISQIQHFTTRT